MSCVNVSLCQCGFPGFLLEFLRKLANVNDVG